MFKTKNKDASRSEDSKGLKTLGGWLLSKMAKGGAAILRSNADKVNKLNVFPVPDGDTGDNMRMTIESGIRAIENLDTDDIAEVMRVLSHGMLLGARGNSGVILSQFFAGIAKGFEGVTTADPTALGAALEIGVKQAYDSVMTPTEGTILTVAREAVEYAVANITPQTTVREFFADFVGEMHDSLERTPETLTVLKEAGVVDSGGAGLLYIMEGFNRVLNGEDLQEEVAYEKPATSSPEVSLQEDIKMTYGYCTEMLVQIRQSDLKDFNLEAVKAYLSSQGDSVVAFCTDNILKVHVHTFKPENILTYCHQFGEFVSLKVENMSLQHTDTLESPVLPAEEEAKKLYGVVAVCIGEGIEALFKELGTDQVIHGGQTHNPSTNDFLEAFAEIKAENIFVFPNNGNIIMAAQQAKELYTDANVYVLPSKNIGTGYAAISMLDFENPCVEEVVENMTEAMHRVTAGYISPSIRDVEINGVNIKEGDTIGVIEKQIVLSEADETTAACKLAEKMLTEYGKFMLSVFFGKDVASGENEVLQQYLAAHCPDCEVYFIDGGQEIYPYIFTAE